MKLCRINLLCKRKYHGRAAFQKNYIKRNEIFIYFYHFLFSNEYLVIRSLVYFVPRHGTTTSRGNEITVVVDRCVHRYKFLGK